jgi:streptogramin lyase
MRIANSLKGATALAGLLFTLAAPAFAADPLLHGAIKSVAGEKMGGVAVSAKADGSNITTTVYTDEGGEYVFPPLAAGKYNVWAQALTFETAKGAVDLAAANARDFTLKPMADFVAQLPGDEILAALPGETPDDARMKTLVRKNCTGCHTPSYPLQHKFDEQGWNAILNTMKQINVLGTHVPERALNGTIDTHQKEIAAYLARARGPGESSMRFHLKPRPSGEAARVVYREYDVPMDPDAGLPYKYLPENGSDWSRGTGSLMNGANGVHDAQLDLDGNMWFTQALPTRDITIGRIDAKTGETKFFKLGEPGGYASNSHGIIRDPNGIMWFNSRPSAPKGLKPALVKLDPKTETLTKYEPPEGMAGTAGSLDYDGQGQIWVTSPFGALRFDPVAEKFQEFMSVTSKNDNGNIPVYGVAADRDGNGWWAGMAQDFIETSDIKTGKSSEMKLPPDAKELAKLTPDEKAYYQTYKPVDFNSPFPWAQGPRRMGTDKTQDVMWVANSFGGNYARIDTKTKEVKIVPTPDPDTLQPYHVSVDSQHRAWTNMWSTDRITNYDPATDKWTLYDLPSRGTEARYISVLERPGQPMQVVVPYSRVRKVAVMTFRTDDEIEKQKQQAVAR